MKTAHKLNTCHISMRVRLQVTQRPQRSLVGKEAGHLQSQHLGDRDRGLGASSLVRLPELASSRLSKGSGLICKVESDKRKKGSVSFGSPHA